MLECVLLDATDLSATKLGLRATCEPLRLGILERLSSSASPSNVGLVACDPLRGMEPLRSMLRDRLSLLLLGGGVLRDVSDLASSSSLVVSLPVRDNRLNIFAFVYSSTFGFICMVKRKARWNEKARDGMEWIAVRVK